MKAVKYSVNNAGIRVEDELNNAVQIAGNNSLEVKREIDNKGFCDIVIQYLEKIDMETIGNKKSKTHHTYRL